MHVIVVAPNFPLAQRQFVRALKEVGATVTGLGDTPVEGLDSELAHWLDAYERVPHLGDEDALYRAVRRIQDRGPWVDRLECTVENHMLPTARVRERASIPGLSADTVLVCRDKAVMKQFLTHKGIPCAAYAAVDSLQEARAFFRKVDGPVILKPRDGAGAHATYRIDREDQLLQAAAEVELDRRPGKFIMEEFLLGHEGFYDTLVVGGRIVFEAVSHYYPNVLEGMRTRWISPQVITTNRIDAEGYDELKRFGRRVIGVLGLDTTPTHMEWFYGGRGLKFAEIGARPPGCNFWDMYCAANDIDLYRHWAEAICYGHTTVRPSRQYSAGLVSVRPSQDGTIAGYTGVEDIQRKYGAHIFNMHLPGVGGPTAEVGAGFLGHAWVWVKHRDYDTCRAILDDVGRTLKMWAR